MGYWSDAKAPALQPSSGMTSGFQTIKNPSRHPPPSSKPPKLPSGPPLSVTYRTQPAKMNRMAIRYEIKVTYKGPPVTYTMSPLDWGSNTLGHQGLSH